MSFIFYLQDAPGLRASANNILLANLCLCNLLVSTVVFPFSAIYVGYAHANGTHDVGMVWRTISVIGFPNSCLNLEQGEPLTSVTLLFLLLFSQFFTH